MAEAVAPIPVLSVRNVAKSFGAAIALRKGCLDSYGGSIHALVGENGAGKSTLVKVIAGVHHRDGGEFLLSGRPVDFRNTAEAKAAGVAVIYQEPTLFPDLSVTENIFMGRQPVLGLGRIDRRRMRSEAADLLERLGVRLNPDRVARGLSIADQQVIEIAKAISLDAKVLVMDEPTAALSGVEVDRLFTITRALRDEGRAIIFISHRFEEIYSLCDTLTVMRDGEYVSAHAIGDVTVDEVVRRMVGRSVTDLFPKEAAPVGDVRLRVEGLTSSGKFHDINFVVRSGEIVCLAGLVGSGRTEIVRAVFGVDGYDRGTVTVDGHTLPMKNPAAAIAAGIALVPEDRRKQGLVMDFSVRSNMSLAVRDRLSVLGILPALKETRLAMSWAHRLQVKTSSLDSPVATLSGGNQQKVVLGKWLATEPRVLIIDEPTRGIDVGTKSEVHRLMSELAGHGVAILMISSELPEVIGMADRVLVMKEGHMTAELSRADANPETVMYAATHSVEKSA
ncbi:sugar ABC transporter ATP-binding protein [Acrocarpospora catenulata]|uniref:sugar ABC transporter ATP-binding protein n=1 Tax=Acrocarpospora catenulata TaxID=2836182 RepID=UPI0027E07A4C|nr:sugar ABC transporter ATP-binding protein [Acrocarpospora catenulata]